ncbi:hypothetical protein FRC04_011233 [Tulasnella sp. 424]|nr:hypothetical protein FRC04_011233 [Tulasnella sp. 424]KAG8971766.1 hypothetical protein FRC05_010833 [Tulasnella sp. 425]
MTDSEPGSEDRDVSDYDSQSGSQSDDDPDLDFLLKICEEISAKVPSVWSANGAIWTNVVSLLMGDDHEMFGVDESDPAYEEDPLYKPVHSVQDIVKWGTVWLENDNTTDASVKDPILHEMYEWLSTKESPRGSPELNPEPEETTTITDEPPITYHLGLLDLPYELLAEVIQLALYEDSHIVMTMSHVGRGLRTFTLSTPSLWTIIDIAFPEERINAYLEQSGSCPLRVRASLVFLTTDWLKGTSKLVGFRAMIQPHATRIASLEMRYTNAHWTFAALSHFSELGEFSSLDEFDYGNLVHRSNPALEEFQLKCSPRMIRLEGVAIKTFRSIYSERVISLKVTECWERGLTDWGEALQSMPSLQVLELSDFQIGDPEPGENAGFGTSIPHISLPHLQSLSLVRVPRAVLGGLLNALQTPSLISASIAFLEPDGLHGYFLSPQLKAQPTHGMSEVALLPFVSANSQLEELNLHNCWMTPDLWTTVLAQLHNLRKLRIASSDVTGEALASLVVSPDRSPSLPFLTHITLDNESLDMESDLSFPFIDQLITTRWNFFHQQQANGWNGQADIAPLKSVVLRGWNESHIPSSYRSEELTRLRGCVEHFHLKTLQRSSEDGGELTDGEWETQSEGSWTSGDQAVVDLGAQVHNFEWGLQLGN